jgi:hypothetical protein
MNANGKTCWQSGFCLNDFRKNPMVEGKPDIFQRVVVGPVLIVAGVAIYAGLFLLSRFPPKGVLHATGVALGAEAYGVVAGLFVLLGVKYMLGPRNWIETHVSQSLTRLVIVSALMSAMILVGVLLIVW